MHMSIFHELSTCAPNDLAIWGTSAVQGNYLSHPRYSPILNPYSTNNLCSFLHVTKMNKGVCKLPHPLINSSSDHFLAEFWCEWLHPPCGSGFKCSHFILEWDKWFHGNGIDVTTLAQLNRCPKLCKVDKLEDYVASFASPKKVPQKSSCCHWPCLLHQTKWSSIVIILQSSRL